MMRLMERAAGRAGLPVKFSQGFNPRPKMTLPLPHPVGVAGQGELLILELTEPLDGDALLQRLGAQLPEGIVLTRCESVASGMLHAASADFSLTVDAPRAQALARRLDELTHQEQWPWQRTKHDAPAQSKSLDLRVLVQNLSFDGHLLTFTLVPRQQAWARVEEVLALLGLDEELDRARTVRTLSQWETTPR